MFEFARDATTLSCSPRTRGHAGVFYGSHAPRGPRGKWISRWTSLLSREIRIQHISSHWEAVNGTLDFDDWTAYWNGRADHEALAAHLLRSPDVEGLQKWMVQHHRAQIDHRTQISHLKELIELHFEVAQTSFDQTNEAQEDPEDEEEGDRSQVLDQRRVCPQQDLWQLDLPLDLHADWRSGFVVDKFGANFTGGMFRWLRGIASEEHAVAFKMLFLEIAIWISAGKLDLRIPHPQHSKKLHWIDPGLLPPAVVNRSTVASVLKLVRSFFGAFLAAFESDLCPADKTESHKAGSDVSSKGHPIVVRL